MVHQELKMIQGCISRMSQNSFYLKGWYVSLLFLGTNVLIAKQANHCYIAFLVLILSLAFWYLDSFCLKMETLYRWKYEWVIKERIRGNTRNFYDLNPYNQNMWIDSEIKKNNLDIWHYSISKTIWPFYALGIIIAVFIYGKGV